MNISKYLPRGVMLAGAFLYAAVTLNGCGNSNQIRIDSIPNEKSIHQIYFNPPLYVDFECLFESIQDYMRAKNDNSTRNYYFKLKDGTLGAIVIAPKETGELYESDIERIAKEC